MKKYIVLLCSAIFIFGLTTCLDEGMDFDTNGGKGLSFVHFVGSNLTMSVELAETEKVPHTTDITVSSTTKSDQARTYTLVVSGTAIEGTHYTLSSKTVTIPANSFDGKIKLSLVVENLAKDAVTAVISINSDEAISYAKSINVIMNRYDLCDFDPSMLIGKFDWVADEWHEAGSVTLEADPDDPYKIYIAGIPAEDLTWNGNKIVLTVEPWVEGAGMTQLSLTGPKTVIADNTAEWGPAYNYDNYAYEVISGSYSICNGTYTITFSITVDQGPFGNYEFIFSK